MEKVTGKNKAIGGSWEEYEKEIFTPEEIAEIAKRAALLLDKEKTKAAMIDAAILHAEETIANDTDDTSEIELDPSGTPLTPGHPKICLGSGAFPGFECCCDNCDFFLKCFPKSKKN